MSDLLTETSNPQRKFLKLAMLAMEKTRKGKERKSATHRIEDIDGRLAEIETQTGDLLEVVTAGRNAASSAEEKGTQAPRAPNGPRAAPRSRTRGLRLRY
jgi:hypothetical protein